ncbi:flagellar hook-associated protein 3 [Kineosporia sp. NBRC 101677]|uniref:flagellin N-terminal helical domain-containing protein n=1 Tax=Kineosporia sp. NBRC 101677 TaxID=3032197 RepID=UPI0024A144D7|nr:flagellin [Kineosporia sp. NBRC 101677]GLY13937.1 flagellar hook-associated protein 3 [Kineosporia sp. NBRC 101677]
MARVTQLGQMNQSLAQIQNSLNAASRLQEQAASGKRINKASDDPTGAAISMQLRDQQAANTQYVRNADYANGQLATVDSTLQSIFSRLNQVRSNIVATAGTSSEQSRSALSAQVVQLKGELQGLYNTQYQGRSIFGGTSPVGAVAEDGTFTGDGNPVMVQLNSTSTVRVDVDGATIGAGEFSGLLDTVAQDILDGSAAQNLTAIDGLLNEVITATGQVGAIQNRVTSSTRAIESQNADLTVSLAQNEDIDYAEVLTRFSSQQVAYQAALGVTARLNQTSLLDFLQ